MSTPAPIPLDADLLCGHCAHNLRGVTSERCPECGRRFDRSRIVTAVVPWELRRQPDPPPRPPLPASTALLRSRRPPPLAFSFSSSRSLRLPTPPLSFFHPHFVPRTPRRKLRTLCLPPAPHQSSFNPPKYPPKT